MIIYLLKVNIILALLCLLFQALMHRDTFFGVRRLMLWGIYITAFLLPLCNVQGWLSADTAANDMAEAYASYVLPTLNVTAMRVASFGVEQSEPGCGMWFVGMLALWGLIYLIPVVWMTAKLLWQVVYIIYLRCTCSPLGMTNDESRFARNDESGRMTNDKSRSARNDESKSLSNPESNSYSSFFTLHSSFYYFPRPCSPFSFGPWIFIHPEGMDEQTLREVLIHEQAHVRGWHTLDILFSQLVCIIFWWNPAAWLMRREVRMNLEFIADKAVADYIEVNSERMNARPRGTLDPSRSEKCEADIFHFSLKTYQYRLLGFSLQKNVATIVNNFNVLPLKRRIKMMNLQRTPRTGMLKYILYVPVAAVMLFLSNIDSLARSIVKEMKPIAHIEQALVSPQTPAPLSKEINEVADVPAAGRTAATAETLVETDSESDVMSNDNSLAASIHTLERIHDDALWIIDGNVASAEEAAELRTEIEHIAVMQGEEAMAKWGSRGTNGVIIVTTKDAEMGPDDKIYETCEQLPEYPGGLDAMFKSLIENVRYPKVAHDYGVQGKVMVSFVVEKDGTLTEVKADKARDVKTGQELSEMVVVAYNRDQTPEEAKKAEEARHFNEGLAALKAEAMRAVKAMPQRWTPGKDKGQPVRVRFNLPVSFRLQ